MTAVIVEAIAVVSWLLLCAVIWRLTAAMLGLDAALRDAIADHLGADLKHLSNQMEVSARFANTGDLTKAVLEVAQQMALQREMMEPAPIPQRKVVSIVPDALMAETDEERE